MSRILQRQVVRPRLPFDERIYRQFAPFWTWRDWAKVGLLVTFSVAVGGCTEIVRAGIAWVRAVWP